MPHFRLMEKPGFHPDEAELLQPVNCLVAQANAHGVRLGLDIGHVISRSDIERVEILIDNSATQRMAELADDILFN
ncbi:hypothetical protein Q3407_07695 [Pseudomonas fulva]|uniref:hypothetical protein n=1 Tax=Pseudomonas fulva TaxID=47880 RepID=UPI001C8ED59D|nr:hypothetical protein [Pseudomonas fulva]WKU97178.1 hypothetical protein Q3407_07695 [Pseudomonas fulva]